MGKPLHVGDQSTILPQEENQISKELKGKEVYPRGGRFPTCSGTSGLERD